MSETPKGKNTPPNLKKSSNSGSTAIDGALKKENKILPLIAILVIATLAFGAWMLLFNGKKGNDDPSPSPSPTTSSMHPTHNNGNNQTTQPSANPSGGKVEPTVSASTDKAQNVADEFIKKIKSGKAGEDWAKDMKPLITNAMYESLKYADPQAIPAAKQAKVSGGAGKWTVNALDDKGNIAYTFFMNGYATEGVSGEPNVLVRAMDIPSANEPSMDKDGHPLPTPVVPFNDAIQKNLEQQAYGVAKTYFEFTASDLPENRTAKVKQAVNGGEVPPLRPTIQGKNLNVQMYGPTNMHMFVSQAGEQTKENFITLGMNVQYADAISTDQKPWEEVAIAVDFKWNQTTRSWTPGGLRVISARPLQ